MKKLLIPAAILLMGICSVLPARADVRVHIRWGGGRAGLPCASSSHALCAPARLLYVPSAAVYLPSAYEETLTAPRPAYSSRPVYHSMVILGALYAGHAGR